MTLCEPQDIPRDIRPSQVILLSTCNTSRDRLRHSDVAKRNTWPVRGVRTAEPWTRIHRTVQISAASRRACSWK